MIYIIRDEYEKEEKHFCENEDDLKFNAKKIVDSIDVDFIAYYDLIEVNFDIKMIKVPYRDVTCHNWKDDIILEFDEFMKY
jgi:hypothetical protein